MSVFFGKEEPPIWLSLIGLIFIVIVLSEGYDIFEFIIAILSLLWARQNYKWAREINRKGYLAYFIGLVFNLFGLLFYCWYYKSKLGKTSVEKPSKSFRIKTPEKEVSTLYAKPKEHKAKTSSSKNEIQLSFDKKQEEIKSFFESLKNKRKENVLSYTDGTILDDTNYNLFYSFINEAKESLCILTWKIDERLLSELLWFLKDKNINIKIITKSRTNQGCLDEFEKYCSNLKLNRIHRNKIHAKLIIRDNKYLALGSSNFTEPSMSEAGHFLDCNTITQHKGTVQNAIDLFNSLQDNKDYTKKTQDSKLMYSRNHKDYLPFSLKPYFENEKEEIILLFSCGMVDKRIIDIIIQWNSETPIKLYVGDTWATSGLSKDNLSSMKWLYETSINDYKNVSVIPIIDDVHSKLYLFKSQETAFISSQNLTVESWQSLLEAVVITSDKKDIEYLLDSIKSFKKSHLDKIESEDLEETSKPESTFSGSKYEESISIPWELPEANEKCRIPRTRGQSYFKLVKYKPREKKEKFFESIGKREGQGKIIKSPIIEDLESEYLSKQSVTGLYSRPTRYNITGKLSKRKQIRDLERKLEYFNGRCNMASSEKEK